MDEIILIFFLFGYENIFSKQIKQAINHYYRDDMKYGYLKMNDGIFNKRFISSEKIGLTIYCLQQGPAIVEHEIKIPYIQDIYI